MLCISVKANGNALYIDSWQGNHIQRALMLPNKNSSQQEAQSAAVLI